MTPTDPLATSLWLTASVREFTRDLLAVVNGQQDVLEPEELQAVPVVIAAACREFANDLTTQAIGEAQATEAER